MSEDPLRWFDDLSPERREAPHAHTLRWDTESGGSCGGRLLQVPTADGSWDTGPAVPEAFVLCRCVLLSSDVKHTGPTLAVSA